MKEEFGKYRFNDIFGWKQIIRTEIPSKYIQLDETIVFGQNFQKFKEIIQMFHVALLKN